MLIIKKIIPKPIHIFLINIKLFIRDIKSISLIKRNNNKNILILNSKCQYFNKGPHNYCHFITGHFYQLYLQWTFHPWSIREVNYDFVGLLPYHIKFYNELFSKDNLLNLNSLTFNIKKPNKIFYNNIIYLDNIDNLMSNSPNYPKANEFHQFVIDTLKIKEYDKKYLTLIERSPRSDRSITNHDELKKSLDKLSIDQGLVFLNIKLETLKYDIKKQIEIMYNSKILIGQHGAGLANLFFVHKNATVFEINSSEYKRFEKIASSRNVKYHEIRLNSTNPNHPKNSHLYVDPDHINSLILSELSNDVNTINISSSF